MRLSYTILFFILSISLSAQSLSTRTMIEGQVNVPPGDEVEGIVVYNETSQKGTITNRNGVFFISVRQDDQLRIRSLQFTPFELSVDPVMIKNKKIIVTLNESLNELNEIVVSPVDLSGNIEVDVNRVVVQADTPSLEVPPAGLRRGVIDDASPVENDALDNEEWKYGLDFINIFKALFDKRDTDTEAFTKTAEDELSEMYSNTFFKKNLEMDEQQIGPFMDYVAVNGLDKQMLEQGNELTLIQFLIQQREGFEQQQTTQN